MTGQTGIRLAHQVARLDDLLQLLYDVPYQPFGDLTVEPIVETTDDPAWDAEQREEHARQVAEREAAIRRPAEGLFWWFVQEDRWFPMHVEHLLNEGRITARGCGERTARIPVCRLLCSRCVEALHLQAVAVRDRLVGLAGELGLELPAPAVEHSPSEDVPAAAGPGEDVTTLRDFAEETGIPYNTVVGWRRRWNERSEDPGGPPPVDAIGRTGRQDLFRRTDLLSLLAFYRPEGHAQVTLSVRKY